MIVIEGFRGFGGCRGGVGGGSSGVGVGCEEGRGVAHLHLHPLSLTPLFTYSPPLAFPFSQSLSNAAETKPTLLPHPTPPPCPLVQPASSHATATHYPPFSPFTCPCFQFLTDIVEIKHIMLPPNPRDYKDIYVVFELMETDLHQVRASRWRGGVM